MALQVWLPLNGTLENKGLSNVTITNNGATVDNNGKIGKCYSFNGSSNNLQGTLNLNNTEMSACCWVKNTKSSQSYLYFLSLSSGSGYVTHQLAISYEPSGIIKFVVNGNYDCAVNNTSTEWQHLAVTYKNNIIICYVNGNEVARTTQSSTLSGTLLTIGARREGTASSCSMFSKSLINDVRIYNHALSQKEVKEISKGLILHYKLDGNDIGMTIPRNGGLIPDGVELYDYILSNGTLYIDTEVKGIGEFEAYSKFMYLSDYGVGTRDRWQSIGGCRDGGNNRMYIFQINSGKFQTGYIDYNENTSINAVSSTLYEGYNILKNGQYDISINSQNDNFTYSGNLNINANIWLFGLNYINPPADAILPRYYSLRIYYFKLVHNGNVVRNFFPCTYLGEPGMWDTVENKFYRNQGTGQFTLGNKITLKEYEYLLGDGSSHIDTKTYGRLNTRVDLKITTTEDNNYSIFGDYTTANLSTFCIGRDGGAAKIFALFDSVSPNIINTLASTANTTYTINLSKDGFINDNTKYREFPNATTFTTANTLKIFEAFYSAKNKGKFKLHYCKIYENNQLVRDLIPVSYNGTPGLWDKVEWKFYGNAGSGSFTLGPEKTVQQDAPIFYDSSGYCNHGSITGTLTTNSDSPRYTKSTLVGNNQIISNNINVRAPYTISYWQKAESTENFTTNYYMVKWGNMFIYRDHNGTYQYSLLSSGILPLNRTSWNHIVVVDNGSTIKAYINGNSSVSRSHTTTISTVEIGRGYNDFYASDFRIYATALSEEDVKELYNTSAFVTNNGVFAEYELYEDNLSDVKKTGLLETANFYENGAESGYALDTDKTRVASNYIISEDFIEI